MVKIKQVCRYKGRCPIPVLAALGSIDEKHKNIGAEFCDNGGVNENGKECIFIKSRPENLVG